MDSTQDPLAQLRDIHLPDAVSIWPPAIGWWLLMLLVLMLCAAAYWLYRYFIRPNYRKAALAELDQFSSSLSIRDEQSVAENYMGLSILLRRITITLFDNKKFKNDSFDINSIDARSVAGIAGESWLKFLDQTGDTDFFVSGQGRLLITAPYIKSSQFTVNAEEPQGHQQNIEMLIDQVKRWVVKNT